MSYDDGKLEDKRLLDIFNKNGIKGTFNINYGVMDEEDHSTVKHPRFDKEEIISLYDGHEIATHGYTHATMARLPITGVVNEIVDDRKKLEELTGKIIRGHAYPNGSFSKEIKELLPMLGIAYARAVETTHSFDLPEDPYEWKGTCHHNDPKLLELAKTFADFQKKQYLKLMYVWGHSYEFADNDNWNVIEDFCKILGNRDDIWYATNIEFIDYMAAAKSLIFSADTSRVYNPTSISVWLSLNNGAKIVEIKSGKTVHLEL